MNSFLAARLSAFGSAVTHAHVELQQALMGIDRGTPDELSINATVQHEFQCVKSYQQALRNAIDNYHQVVKQEAEHYGR